MSEVGKTYYAASETEMGYVGTGCVLRVTGKDSVVLFWGMERRMGAVASNEVQWGKTKESRYGVEGWADTA